MVKRLGLDLWERAKTTVLGGNGLLSKRPERYSPKKWPTYFQKAKGTTVWSLDGDCYEDMAQMGLGTAILGYANDELDELVKEAISNGINCTLNAPEEQYLAQKLLSFNDNAYGKVKFARSGGEALSQAIRIARSSSHSSKVAFSGYHGWHDWYLAANLGQDNLSDHLLPGLQPLGVPKELDGTSIPFKYNDPDAVYALMENHSDVGVICVEGARYEYPSKDFIMAINDFKKHSGAILISDEITSGWRLGLGGVFRTLGGLPDMEVYAKALGGGYAISAVVGKDDVMEASQASFMSSTMWTERVGFVAALGTLKILERDQVAKHLNDVGEHIGEIWRSQAEKVGLKIQITDFKPLITFKFCHEQLNDVLVTLFCEMMLDRGYLASTSVYISAAHKIEMLDEYSFHVGEVFYELAKMLDSKKIKSKLDIHVRSDAFGRLT